MARLNLITLIALLLNLLLPLASPGQALAAGSAAPGTACIASPPGLVAWWPGEASAQDVQGGHDGAISGAVAFVPGEVGQGFSFDGNDSFVNVADSGFLNNLTSALTLEAWINPQPSPSGSGWIFAHRDPFISEGFGVIVSNDGTLSVALRTANNVDNVYGSGFPSAPGAVTFGQLQHVAVTVNTATGAVLAYVNGQQVTLTQTYGPAITGSTLYPVNNLFIGQRQSNNTTEGVGGGGHYAGVIDELSVYSRDLAPAEIQAIVNAGNAGKCTSSPAGPLSWWKADGNSLDSVGPNNGTLQGNTTYTPGAAGQAFNFDGQGDAVVVGSAPNLQLQNFSIESWVKRASSTQTSLDEALGPSGVIFTFGQNGYGFGIFDDGRLFLSQIGVSHVASANPMVTDTNFHHVAVTKSGSSVTFYVDGVASAAPPYDPGFTFGTPATIGARGDNLLSGLSSNSFLGLIDEVKLYNRALSAAEVRAEYAAVTPPATPLAALAPISGTQPGFSASPYPYMGTAITVDPYPPTINQPVTLGALLQNPTAAAVTLTSVDFAISGYGLGLTWQPIGSVANVTLPAASTVNGTSVPGTAHPTISWTPPFSGHHCVQVTLHFADGSSQVLQRNIDIAGFSTGGPVVTGFQVGNPSGTAGTITLKLVPVAQTPQGWSATLDQTSLALAPGALANVNLTITPPVGAAAGSYATYNVEGYLGTALIGGISKTVVIGGSLPAPTVTSPTAGATGPLQGSLISTGTALPYAYIRGTVGGTVFETIADGSGAWSLPITLSGSAPYTLSVTQSLGGVTSAPATVSWGSTGPISWWKAEGNAVDSVGPNNGTLQGSATFVAGAAGQAFTFDGAGYVQVPNNASLQPSSQITITGAIKPVFAGRPAVASDVDTILERYDGSLGYGLFLAMDPAANAFIQEPAGGVPLGTPGFWLNTSSSGLVQIFGASPVPNDGAYHQVTASYDGATMQLFLDGTPVASRPVSGAIVHASTADAFIGRENVYGPRNSRAAMDEVRLYGRALSAAEVQALGGAVTPPAPLPALAPISGTQPGFPASPYPYMGAAITVDPYPPTINQPVTLGALLQNPTASAVTLTSADFAISGYGLGLTWQPVGSVANVTIPAATSINSTSVPGTAHPTISWTPPFSGHHCVQVTLHFADGSSQVLQRNIDILGFSMGGPVVTGFQVGNSSGATGTITLKIVPVAQTPQGWTATLDQTSLALAPGALANVNLTITPPSGAPAGSSATFNVEGYLGTALIGGISKTVVIGSSLPAPTVTSPTAGATGPLQGSLISTGTALPYAYIRGTLGSAVFETIADGSGAWSLLVTLSGSVPYTISVTQSLGGVTSAPATVSWGSATPAQLSLSSTTPNGGTVAAGPAPSYSGTANFTATLSNVANPNGTPVTFTVTGANPQTATAPADGSGTATFHYTGANAGTDTVVATATAGGTTVTSGAWKVTWGVPAPIITNLVAGGYVPGGRLTITGTTVPYGHIICRHRDGAEYWEVDAGADGGWSLTIDLSGVAGEDILYVEDGSGGGYFHVYAGGAGGFRIVVVDGSGGGPDFHVVGGSGGGVNDVYLGDALVGINAISGGGTGSGATYTIYWSASGDDVIDWTAVDGGPCGCLPDGAIVFHKLGTRTLSYYVVDQFGHKGPIRQRVVRNKAPMTVTNVGATPGAFSTATTSVVGGTAGHTTITYTLSEPGTVTVRIFNGSGALVRTLVNGASRAAGTYTTTTGDAWDGKDDHGLLVSNCGCHAQVDGVDSTGNTALSGSAPIVVDATPPAASITGGPANPTNQDTPFAFAATDPVVNGVASGVDHLECSLDGAAFAPCQSGISYPGLAEGAHTFQVRPIDKAGNIGAPAKWPWVIDRTAPVVANLVANPVPLNTAGTLTATVTDPNGANGAAPSGIAGGTYTVDSGAPAPLTPQAGASFGGPSVPVTATLPAFSTTGVHTICVTAQDAAGNPSATQCALLAVYDPNAGFVTGGGWINSPAGACLLTTACQGASGRADFGFVSKYQKGATVPTGQTEFQFKAGNLNFHSTSYDWLVIGGAKAQYKGSGTINGAGSYSFMLTAIDGDLLGGGTPDKFRIKIWDTASGATVYDNQMGATDSADPTTAIAGGSIVIHKS